MLLKYFYDTSLAHASYMVGCQRTGEAIVIDPGRNVEPYLEAAAAEGLRITGSAETHIHADFVSGSRELADRVGAKLYLSDEGPADWKYQFADQHSSQLVKNGDVIRVGKVKLEVLHTLRFRRPTKSPAFTGEFEFGCLNGCNRQDREWLHTVDNT